MEQKLVMPLLNEANELTAMFAMSVKYAKDSNKNVRNLYKS